MKIIIQKADPKSSASWLKMRCALWPEGSRAEHRREIAAYFAGSRSDPHTVLIAQATGGSMVGFVELTLRSHAEGCKPGSIAYLEGWYVAPKARGCGIGRALIAASERWARESGCREFASDAWSTNIRSKKAHLALGFEEVGTIRCFRKRIRGSVAQPAVPADGPAPASLRQARG